MIFQALVNGCFFHYSELFYQPLHTYPKLCFSCVKCNTICNSCMSEIYCNLLKIKFLLLVKKGCKGFTHHLEESQVAPRINWRRFLPALKGLELLECQSKCPWPALWPVYRQQLSFRNCLGVSALHHLAWMTLARCYYEDYSFVQLF